MKIGEFFDKWSLSSLKVNLGLVELEFGPKDEDKDAAWDLYVELSTRITTQALPDGQGVEATALESVFKIFEFTRSAMRTHGRHADQFAAIALTMMNVEVRPFTAKWHAETHEKPAGDGFDNPAKCTKFRDELKVLQVKLRNYAKMLADLAGVTHFEAETRP